jgi:hypothetical protein
MTPEELRAAGRLTGRAAAGIARYAQNDHISVAGRVFRRLEPVAAPVELVHTALVRAADGAVRKSLRTAGAVVGETLAAAAPASARPIAASRAGAILQAVLNGVLGDDLHADSLGILMAVRLDGRDVPLTTIALAAAFPDAASYVVMFVHGLFEDDRSCRGVFGDRLPEDTGCTPLYVRYNTGRPVADNGADLSSLLSLLVDVWPVRIDRCGATQPRRIGHGGRKPAYPAGRPVRLGPRQVRRVTDPRAPGTSQPSPRSGAT